MRLLIFLLTCIQAHLVMSQPLPTIIEVDADFDRPFYMRSAVPWLDTGINIQKGQRYTITASSSADYKDSIIACDPDGPTTFVGRCFDLVARKPQWFNPLRWGRSWGVQKNLRVLCDGTFEKKRASFLTLVASIGMDDRQNNVITVGRNRSFVAHADGPLFLFVNDWPGGPGFIGEDRFVQIDKKGGKTLPTYGNNKGYLTVTVRHHSF